VLWHCWLGYLTRIKPISYMTYNVCGGTLNLPFLAFVFSVPSLLSPSPFPLLSFIPTPPLWPWWEDLQEHLSSPGGSGQTPSTKWHLTHLSAWKNASNENSLVRVCKIIIIKLPVIRHYTPIHWTSHCNSISTAQNSSVLIEKIANFSVRSAPTEMCAWAPKHPHSRRLGRQQ